ncbi:MAG: endopeptidase La [Planctomycetes bacterium]|nr:endopeptidase La [Planctomycetota bacterium]
MRLDGADGADDPPPAAGDDAPAAEPAAVRIPEVVPVIPIRNTVVFPGTVIPLTIGRERSRRLLEDVLPKQKIVLLVAQRRPDVEEPRPEDLHQYGTAAVLLRAVRNDEGHQTVVVHGLIRARLDQYVQSEPYMIARITPLPDRVKPSTTIDALMLSVRQEAARVIELSPNVPDEARFVLDNIDAPGALADFLASNLPLDTRQKQGLLETLNVADRLRKISQELGQQLQVLELSSKIQEQVRSSIDRSQREYFLHEQLKAIQEELGQTDERTEEINELSEKIAKADMPPPVRKTAERELERFRRIPQASPEHHIVRTYLDWLTEVPWSVQTADTLDIAAAQRILEADHYGLERVKKRILEYLAVRKLAPHSRGPILCFVGPPGVGKTSLGQSIARALGRKFIRMSLGGIRDEAELRGHRRTYIGAMPGRIVQEIAKAGSINPVFMLDEVDKVGQDFRGDPSSALLEVLDPAQNNSFQDHYLNVPLDLSRVLFIATANYMGTVPPALQDRMETIELPGYTPGEKLMIARRYLVPRQRQENGLKASQLTFTDAALDAIIDRYTREAGVRELERQVGAVCRAVAAKVARGSARKRTVDVRGLGKFLGPAQYESEIAQRTSVPGVATGLFYTPAGGGVLFIEATRFAGHGRLTLTGQIGEVMRESAHAAFSLVRSRAEQLGIDEKQLGRTDVHVHVPAGAVPKDGPSAGTAIVTALVSLLRGRAVRPEVAMTGEITLRGLVLPVGGIKQKILAARQAGITTVILPARNRKDVTQLPPEVKKGLELVFASQIGQVLKTALGQ